MATENEEISDLNDIVLKERPSTDSEQNSKPLKKPKRILHFSDGVLEEYSSDEETPASKMANTVVTADPKTLDWLPWAWYQTTWVSSKMLEGCDCVGEYLADLFGITTPKYQFEINEYYRLKAQEEEVMRKTDLEMGGWNDKTKNNLILHNEEVLSNSNS